MRKQPSPFLISVFEFSPFFFLFFSDVGPFPFSSSSFFRQTRVPPPFFPLQQGAVRLLHGAWPRKNLFPQRKFCVAAETVNTGVPFPPFSSPWGALPSFFLHRLLCADVPPAGSISISSTADLVFPSSLCRAGKRFFFLFPSHPPGQPSGFRSTFFPPCRMKLCALSSPFFGRNRPLPPFFFPRFSPPSHWNPGRCSFFHAPSLTGIQKPKDTSPFFPTVQIGFRQSAFLPLSCAGG